eukprot:TRINITY_DN6386_c0_g1_i2.p3 TRINITY_DN6386_c0_g1~~TRINITY_DN6386_c0_g1_i2.p3  ORF type:complete len:269 (-),score=142.04 TRINITY_DN6386_c0_g1_i2:31-837(-)
MATALEDKIAPFIEKYKQVVYNPFLAQFSRFGPEFDKRGHGTAALQAFFLGSTFGIGIGLYALSENYNGFGLYAVLLSLFHFLEYVLTAINNPSKLSGHSFLINHGTEYSIAFFFSIFEFFFFHSIFPGFKNCWFFYYIGAFLTVFGLAVRVVGMYTAGPAFTHIVQSEKREEHNIVTAGIYQFTRHPGYVGWFIFTVGLQIILVNFISVPAFGYVMYMFFDQRIAGEEEYLIKMFGDEYSQYRAKVPIIPFFKKPHRWGLTAAKKSN